MKRILIFFLPLSILLFSYSSVSDKELKIFEGVFNKIQSGDYTHLYLTNSSGAKESFICLDLPKNLIKGIDCFEIETKYKKANLKVTYHEETNFIPEAQEKITWNYVDRIDVKKD